MGPSCPRAWVLGEEGGLQPQSWHLGGGNATGWGQRSSFGAMWGGWGLGEPCLSFPTYAHVGTCVSCLLGAHASSHSRKQQQLRQLGVGTRNGHLTVSAAHPLLALPWVPHRELWGTDLRPLCRCWDGRRAEKGQIPHTELRSRGIQPIPRCVRMGHSTMWLRFGVGLEGTVPSMTLFHVSGVHGSTQRDFLVWGRAQRGRQGCSSPEGWEGAVGAQGLVVEALHGHLCPLMAGCPQMSPLQWGRSRAAVGCVTGADVRWEQGVWGWGWGPFSTQRAAHGQVLVGVPRGRGHQLSPTQRDALGW